MDKKDILFLNKCLQQVGMLDYYITKNILSMLKNKKQMNFIKSNIYLLSITNNNNKNSLIILLEAEKFETIKHLIDFEPNILNYKDIIENNLFSILLKYNYFYNYIENKINELDVYFVIKILTTKNKYNKNFIDKLIWLLNINMKYFYLNSSNEKISIETQNLISQLTQLINITKTIYSIDSEKNTFIITKLCQLINNENYLLDILKLFNIDNFDIYFDSNIYMCIDYLIFNEYFQTLVYLLEKINYIQFANIENNSIYTLLESPNINLEIKSEILLKILKKSNISKLKNNKNQNIFYWLINEYHITPSILISFKDLLDIHEEDINGNTLYDLIKKKYTIQDNELITKHYPKQQNDKYLKSIYKNMNMQKKLLKTDNGIFISNINHSMLFTIFILKKNKELLSIPYFLQSNEYKTNMEKLIDMSNNNNNVFGYFKPVFYNYNTWLPFTIIWESKNNYWFDSNLINSITTQSKTVKFIYIKISAIIIEDSGVRHANAIIVDNVNKIIERFEPYGEMIINNSQDINQMIETQIAIPLGYKFVFVQPYPGFQARSDESSQYNQTYGDPLGYCLAWTILYIDIKLELFKLNSKISPIDFINWYIINKFSKDLSIDTNINKTNKYVLFIRYYAKYLDMEKNKIIKKFNLNPGLIYQTNLDNDYSNKLLLNINNLLYKLVS